MLLPKHPQISKSIRQQIAADHERFKAGLPVPLEKYVQQAYGIDLSSQYAGLAIKNPFGKASGQLSLAAHQVQRDATAGLGFVVLKTVIAQNEAGLQSMQEWAIPETRMKVERIRGADGRPGWTVTWKGRGWHESFASYLNFFREAIDIGNAAAMLIVPSCKYHLPSPGENQWRVEEYEFTTRTLLRVWRDAGNKSAMPLEKDFSPTLAGSSHAAQKEKILEWLATVPNLIHRAVEPDSVKVGLKIFNAIFDNEFQLEMLKTAHCPVSGRADFLVYANRLFDPDKVFLGKKGIAFGGPDLSARNVSVLRAWRERECASPITGRSAAPLPISGTGDIGSGRMAAEYLLQGCSSFQIHTLFQLPNSEFAMSAGNKIDRALHGLYFDPEEGFLAWLCHLREAFGWRAQMNVREMAEFCVKHRLP